MSILLFLKYFVSLLMLMNGLSAATLSKPSFLKYLFDYNGFICDTLLNYKDFEYERYFSSSFVQAVPKATFTSILSDLTDAVGRCIGYRTGKDHVEFYSASGDSVSISYHVNLWVVIDGFLIKGVDLKSVVIDSWDSILDFSNKNPSDVAVSIVSYNYPNSSLSLNSQALNPLGSEFKLYVLGALRKKINMNNATISWNKTLPIRNDYKSLPSGIMHTWPEGTLVTLRDFAGYMINISDNTATDHLIHFVGREQVESQMQEMKNDAVAVNKPFLMTSELFKLKWAANESVISQYIASDMDGRRALLNRTIDSIPLSDVGKNKYNMTYPTFINDIEWFASTNAMCDAMLYLNNQTSFEIDDILSRNTPFINYTTSVWSYAAFKGGSEPGVLTLTYFLKTKKSEKGCVSISFKNSHKTINEYTSFDFVAKLLSFSEKIISKE